MTVFQVGVNKESGAVTIWIDAPCGLKPICPDLEALKEFSDMLLEFYTGKKAEKDRIEMISDGLLEQALGGDECFSNGAG